VYTDKYFRIWTGPFPFNLDSVRRNVPDTSGVYQILYMREVVYIGISVSSILDRLTKHATGHGNWAAAHRINARHYEFVYFLCDGQSAQQIESHVIATEKPPFNVKNEYKHYIDNITVH
jgi:excinuclease UvrABC nuclease subunit